MTEFAILPKLLPARNLLESGQKIPKIIWQTMKTNRIPVYMKQYADSWIELNSEYEYRFFDDMDIVSFLEENFPQYLSGYQKLKYGASKADLWRYLIIYKYGGVYADMDCKCVLPLRKWIDPKASFVSQLGINNDLCQWLIISIPGNPIFLKAAERTLSNSKSNNSTTRHYGFEYKDNRLALRKKEDVMQFSHPILGLSGPPVLQAAAEECFVDGSLSDILPSTQIICVSGKISCQMNGNVIHDTQNNEYKKSLRQIHVIHYNNRIEKIKRKLASIFSPFFRNY